MGYNVFLYFLLQYYGAWSNYKSAISYFCKDQKYRLQAVNIAKEEGLLPVAKRSESKRRTKVSTSQGCHIYGIR